MQIDLERKASSKLLAWKNKPNHSTLEVSGARQVGKLIWSISLRTGNIKEKFM